MFSIIIGWVIPIYFYIGLFNLLYVLWIDRTLKIKIDEIISIVLFWPIMWIVLLILKYGK